MTDKETTMYQILGKICRTDAPIVFKGALITKLILRENGYNALDRQTRDIDANWIGAPPPMSELESTINRSLNALNGKFRAEAFREYGDKKSAGLYIVENATGEKIVTMDIDMRPIYGSRIYHYDEIGIKGVLVNEILADKITVLSKPIMFRRAKDLIDVYALAHCVEVRTSEVFDVLKSKSAIVGEFLELFTRRNDVEHAYGKLQGIDGKPPFDDVYPYLNRFVIPFAQKDEKPRIWNICKQGWDDESCVVETRERPASPRQKTRHKDEPER